MNTITIRLPDELRSDLKKLSQEQSKPVSDLVPGGTVEKGLLDENGFQGPQEKIGALRKKALPFAEAQGFLTDEDVFRAIS